MSTKALVDAARKVALFAHHGQFYPPEHGPISFSMHLGHVVSVLYRYEIDDKTTIAAAWLHDILEDTPLTEETLFNRLRAHAGEYETIFMEEPHLFSDAYKIVAVVKAVTDEPGKNRKERKAKTYPKIAENGTRAITVKLADRIANVESSLLGGRGHDYLAIYRREWDDFQKALRHGGPPILWSYLDRLMQGDAADDCTNLEHLPVNP